VRAVPGGRVGGKGERIGRGADSVAAAEVVGPPVGTSGICDDALVMAA
jgi:hypothetical protein